MVEEDRYCTAFLVQLSSVQGPCEESARLCFEITFATVRPQAIASGKTAESDAVLDELVELFANFSR